MKKDLDCKFIRINPDEKDFDEYLEVGKIYNHINKSFKKPLINKISKRILKLEFKSFNKIEWNKVCCQTNISIIIKP